MTERTRISRCAGVISLTLILAGCLDGGSDDESASAGPEVNFTNPAGADQIQTPDIVVNLVGTANSAADIDNVEWVNDRGGRGFANGKENWVTGNIVLQIGTNNITVTATDIDGMSSSKSISVERENPAAESGDDSEITETLYSYSSDFANAAPVRGADIEPVPIYVSFAPGPEIQASNISHVEYRCCKGISGPGDGTAFGAPLAVSNRPWSLAIDLSGMEPGGTRRLRTDIHYKDGSDPSIRVFDFTVAGEVENRQPRISGSPQGTATAGVTYTFKPTATDADGDSLSFWIDNKPSWASFSRTTGQLKGTPSSSDVGVHGNIVISVSDGRSTAKLAPFSIIVAAVSSGSATLTWTPPTERTDGASLVGGLAGYEIHYGQSAQNYSNRITVNNAGLSSYVVDNLASGTWFFSVKAFDTDGQKSEFSNEGQVTVP